MISRHAGTLRIAGILLALYLVSTGLHLYLLRHAFQFPHISSDEVQFAMTGENIRLGRGFTLRGQFNSTVPPLFPAFVALAHSAGPDPRAAMFILSCFVMCAAVFPVFAMAKTCGLDDLTATLLAAAASMLPHTFYAATYMSEVLQYPAYLTAFWLGLCWVEKPTWLRDAAMGGVMGFLLLTKLQGTQFVAAFAIAALFIAIHAYRSNDRSLPRFLTHCAVVLVVTGSLQVAWYLYKLSYGGTELGAYGAILARQGLPSWTPKLALAYFADFLLAPGLVTAVLLFYWLRHNGSYARAVFVLAVFGIQVAAVSTLDGGLTGWLRERLFLYALPITAVLAAQGLAWFKLSKRSAAAYALIGVPLLLIAVVTLYPFAVSSVIEVPWANALGSLAGLVPFSRACLAVAAATLATLVAAILLRTPSHAQVLFGVFVLLFYGFGFACSAAALTAWTARGLNSLAPVVDWLRANDVRTGSRLLIAGRHSYFEDPSVTRKAPWDDGFLDWTWRLGLDEAREWQIETIGLFDVRMISAPAAIGTEGRPGDRFLSIARFDNLNLRSFHDPFRLYTIDAVPRAAAAASSRSREGFSAIAPGEWKPAGASIHAPCFMDAINDIPPGRSVSVMREQGIRMLGWAAAMDSDPAADRVYVELSSQTGVNYWARARRYARPDVAKAFGKPALLESGFSLSAGLGAVPAGRLGLKVVLLNHGRLLECDSGRVIEVR